MKKQAIIFLSGKLNIEANYYKNIDYQNYDIYCADGGANHAYHLGITPQLILGDLDSISDKIKNYFQNLGVEFKKFPKSKDFTDGELILDEVTKKYQEILILGGLGGRTDHFLTNLNFLEKYQNIIYEDDKEIIFFVKKEMKIHNQIGKTISLIPLTSITELTLTGFQYDIDNINISRASSLCMSNIIAQKYVRITYKNGSIIGIIQK